jgi:flagellar hook-length control protein FliK
VPAISVASLPSLINQALDSLQASGNAGQVDQGLLADLAALSQALQANQASAGKASPTTTDGAVDTDSQAANLLASVKTDLSQADPGVLNGNASEGSTANSASAGVLPRAPDGTTATGNLSSQTAAKTGANLLSTGSDLKNSSASTAAQGAANSTTLTMTGQMVGDLSQSSQDSGSAWRSKETQAKSTSFVKLETQQPQELSPQSSSGSNEVNGLLAQPSAQQNDLSPATGLEQTANSTSPTLGDSVFNQIVANATLAVNNNNASMRIQLKPEFLGDLKLVVNVEQGVLNAHFITQNQVTASLIQTRMPELKQALNDQGISWQHLTVSSEAGQDNRQGASYQSQQNTGQSQTQSDYGYEDSTDSNVPPTIPAAYQWGGAGSFNYVV